MERWAWATYNYMLFLRSNMSGWMFMTSRSRTGFWCFNHQVGIFWVQLGQDIERRIRAMPGNNLCLILRTQKFPHMVPRIFWVVSFLLLLYLFVSFLAVLAHDADCGAIGIDDKMRRWDDNDVLHQMALSAPSPKVWTATTMLLSGCKAQWTNDQEMRSSTMWPRIWYFTGNLLNVWSV